MKIDMNTVFGEISVENVSAIQADLSAVPDDAAAKRIRKTVMREVNKKQSEKRIVLRRLTAAAAAVCMIITSAAAVHYHSEQEDTLLSAHTDTSAVAQRKQHFRIMQVYANDKEVEVKENAMKIDAPFFQIKRTYGTWYDADRIISESKTSHGNKIAYRYYPVGEYDDARDGSGYIVSMLYGNYFDIKADKDETIESVELSCGDTGWITVFFSENPGFDNDYLEMNKSGNCIGGKSVRLDKDDLADAHKIMWNTDEGADGLFVKKDFKYSDLNDTITVTVTFDDDAKTTEKAYVDLTFDEEGIMHTAIRTP